MSVEWKEEYSVCVKEIDDQHKNLVKIINKLYKSIYSEVIKKELGKILDELIEFAQIHFATEESYFDKFDYDNSEEHKREHEKFKKEMLDLKNKFENDEIKISFDLVDFLEDWLVHHLMNEDQKYVKCFKEKGLC